MAVEMLLDKTNRIRLAQAFRDVLRVDLGIDCVIEGQMGKAFTDDVKDPSIYFIEVGGLFCYFAGDASSTSARHHMLGLPAYRLLMPSSPGWLGLARSLHQRSLMGQTRYCFSSSNLSLAHLHSLLDAKKQSVPICLVDLAFADRCWSDPKSLIDLRDYDSGQDFVDRSIGYYALDGEAIAGVAYGSLVCSRGIEVSIYVEPQYRRQGLATCLACSLLIWCLKNRMEPHWDAANIESCKLAETLGYLSVGTYEAVYYRGD